VRLLILWIVLVVLVCGCVDEFLDYFFHGYKPIFSRSQPVSTTTTTTTTPESIVDDLTPIVVVGETGGVAVPPTLPDCDTRYDCPDNYCKGNDMINFQCEGKCTYTQEPCPEGTKCTESKSSTVRIKEGGYMTLLDCVSQLVVEKYTLMPGSWIFKEYTAGMNIPLDEMESGKTYTSDEWKLDIPTGDEGWKLIPNSNLRGVWDLKYVHDGDPVTEEGWDLLHPDGSVASEKETPDITEEVFQEEAAADVGGEETTYFELHMGMPPATNFDYDYADLAGKSEAEIRSLGPTLRIHAFQHYDGGNTYYIPFPYEQFTLDKRVYDEHPVGPLGEYCANAHFDAEKALDINLQWIPSPESACGWLGPEYRVGALMVTPEQIVRWFKAYEK
jgi:hypothetical protein